MILLYLMVVVGVFIGCHLNKRASGGMSKIQIIIVSILWPVLLGILLVYLYEKMGE